MARFDSEFSSSIAQVYEDYLVPLLFREYATDLARRVHLPSNGAVLEIAAGTGVLTRELVKSLPQTVYITATDLNQPMLDVASKACRSENVAWQHADALALPFDDNKFDAVLCQFGVMFFPDKAKAYQEIHRVLKPRGEFLFNTWDRLERNPIVFEVRKSLVGVLGSESSAWLERVPFGYNDVHAIKDDLEREGFARVSVETVAKTSRAPSAREAAFAMCLGSPFRTELEEHGAGAEAGVELASAALQRSFGEGPIEGEMSAHVVTAFTE